MRDRSGFASSNTLVPRSQTLLRSEVSQINGKNTFLVISGSQADPRELDDIVLAHTSDNLARTRIFSKKYSNY